MRSRTFKNTSQRDAAVYAIDCLTDCLISYWKKVGYEFSCEVGFYFHRLAANSASFPSVFLQMRVNYEFARDCLSCQKVTAD